MAEGKIVGSHSAVADVKLTLCSGGFPTWMRRERKTSDTPLEKSLADTLGVPLIEWLTKSDRIELRESAPSHKGQVKPRRSPFVLQLAAMLFEPATGAHGKSASAR